MTPDKLLYPRYKVTDKWPGMHTEPFHVGQIITLQPHKEEDAEGFIHIPDKHMPKSFMWQSFFDLYKNLFQPLPWYAERELADMPEYVRYSDYYLNHYHLDGEHKEKIFKVDKWEKGHYGIRVIGEGIIHGYEMNFIPANREDYEQWKQSKNK